jgi:hypothetical protein
MALRNRATQYSVVGGGVVAKRIGPGISLDDKTVRFCSDATSRWGGARRGPLADGSHMIHVRGVSRKTLRFPCMYRERIGFFEYGCFSFAVFVALGVAVVSAHQYGGGSSGVCMCVCACTFPRLWWYAPTCRSPRSSILECVPREVKFFVHFFPCSSEANISAKNRIYRKRLKGKAAVLSEVFFGHGKKREEKNTEQNRRISKPFRNHLLFQ